MCGIMGFVGGRDALPHVIEGLRRLEYRGYDSSGVVVLKDDGTFAWEKCPGKLEALERRLEKRPLKGRLGIGHTRWATHGGVTEMNAHPHFSTDRRIAIVHNGIIENYAELKRKLRGAKFRSETDTEIVVHLVAKHYRGDPLKAVLAAARELRGTYAIVAAFADHPDLLVGARLNAPLVVGLHPDEVLVASDIAALLPHTRRVAPVGEGQVVRLRRTETGLANEAWTLDGKPAELVPLEVTWAADDADKHGHDHFYHKEIFEQPAAIDAELQGRLDAARGTVHFDGLSDAPAKASRLVITACGSSWHAGQVTKYAIEELARIPADIALASELRYGDYPYDRDTLVVAFSQSGETADTLAALRQARDAGAKTLAITNVKGSSISRDARDVVYMRAGLEIGVAATKTYTSQVLLGILLAIHLGRKRGALPLARGRALLKAARAVPGALRRVLDDAAATRAVADSLASCRDYMYIGRRYNLATAYEGALKMKELSYVHAEGYGAGEMKHGPLAIVDERLTTVAVAPRDRVYDKMVSNIQQIRSRGGRVVTLATAGDREARNFSDRTIAIPRVDEIFSPVVTVVPLQLLAYHQAVALGRDVDKPRNLAKSVTVE